MFYVSGFLYVDSMVIDALIRSMAGMFITRVNNLEEESYNPEDVYKSIARDFRILLDPEDASNKILGAGKIKQLEELEDAFTNYPEDIKKEVFGLINIISDQDNESEFKSEAEEDSTGLRKADEFDKDASEIGGFNSLTKKVRSYIATSTMKDVDFFGKTELTEGEPLIVPVKFNEAYNGLLKAVSNISDQAVMLRRMYSYSRLNPNMAAVVDKLFNDANLDIESLSSESPFINVTNASLLQSIVKGFENYKVDYIEIRFKNGWAIQDKFLNSLEFITNNTQERNLLFDKLVSLSGQGPIDINSLEINETYSLFTDGVVKLKPLEPFV